MKIKTVTAFTTLSSVLVLVLLAFGLMQLIGIHDEVVRSEESRFQSYKLADELRQSSDDLTRMARTYVVTGNAQYEQYYFDILAIRNGKQPRSPDYSSTFWWRSERRAGGTAIALQDRMRHAGFSESEFALLAEAQARSDTLVELEREAFDAMRGRFRDGQRTVERAADPAFARALLFGERYHAEKARIMEPIDVFLKTVDTRTSRALRQLEERQISYLQLSLAIVALACLGTLASWAYLNRTILGPVFILRDHVARLTRGASEKIDAVDAVASGELGRDIAVLDVPPIALGTAAPNEMGQLLGAIVRMSEVQRALDQALRAMTVALRSHREREHLLDWHKTGINELNVQMRGDRRLHDMGPELLACVSAQVGAAVGAFYLFDPVRDALSLLAVHALPTAPLEIALGQGVAGAAAVQRRTLLVSPVPADYVEIASATGHAAPLAVLAVPLLHDGNLLGLIEVAGFTIFTQAHLAWAEQAAEALAIAIDVAQSRERVNQLLEQTQMQTEELRVQQEQLQQSNEELEERAQLLEQQRELIRKKSEESEAASVALGRKAAELERVSAYKSEFLANMSHELRTPLNSMLILSNLLRQNRDGRLDPKQVSYAGTIHDAGQDLLGLINDILDLSKIEAGYLELHVDDVTLEELAGQLRAIFQPVADQKQVALAIALSPGTPPRISGDGQRLLQVLKNLLANAFKFTAAGQVSLDIGPCLPGAGPLDRPALAFAVRDSGIGIDPDKHEQIFHAFQQADGSTSRKYGGSGLGLSISRQLARKMGGDIGLESTPGRGSVFTLYLPLVAAGRQAPAATPVTAAPLAAPVENSPAIAPAAAPPVEGDREAMFEQRTVLLVDDDIRNVFSLSALLGEKGMRIIEAGTGAEALEQLSAHPEIDIVLMDTMMPEMDGFEAIRRIRADARWRRLPVISLTAKAMPEDRQQALDAGASDYIAKPVDIDQLFSLMRVWLYQAGAS
ncbi:MAG: ATP-binding protein [Pseudomonadota bacterium]